MNWLKPIFITFLLKQVTAYIETATCSSSNIRSLSECREVVCVDSGNDISDRITLPCKITFAPNVIIETLEAEDIDTLFEGNYSLLKELNVDRNMLTNIHPAVFKRYSKLQKLKAAINQLEEIETNNLVYLDVSLNNIKDASVIKNSKNLKFLNLSDNDISVIKIESSYKLEELNLNNNKIIEASFGEMKKMQKLSLSHNKIKSLHFNYMIYENLIELDLSYNAIKLFPTNIMMNNLRKLKLKSNLLDQDIFNSNCFRNLKNLEILDISYNNLYELKVDGIRNSRNLQELYLQHNKIFKIHLGSFQFSTKLKKIDLSFNSLSRLQQGVFTNLYELTYLNLSNNEMEYIPEFVFTPLRKLASLDISHNRLTYYKYEQITPNSIHIEHNLWDCKFLYHMIKYFRDIGVTILENNKDFYKENIEGIHCFDISQFISFNNKLTETKILVS